MPYNPTKPEDRHILARAILDTLRKADFIEEYVGDKGVNERVFFRVIPYTDDRIRVVVYTSIIGEDHNAQCRSVGTDAIRVCVLYRNLRDEERGIIKTTRVHRTGLIPGITNRMLSRMREAWRKALRPNRCHNCGAPTFLSKKGNTVCAEICWKDRSAEPVRSHYP